ncbi:hypothetical protein [Curtobacterium caseinilyticum]|uniref:Ig-like domain-containing protein n=1 Tax=Curtobacterium caseinilyticum TaxID=3055137 RepID=A0ABT7TMA4_9MICO|nr:hypothetical protein [Curtobacterium caseinilyticum]MDM7890709.1 hypothetical protein [Curtobacterium caseinilyticum]
MRTRIVAATAAAFVLVALAGCTQPSPLRGVAQAACEKKVGPAIVVWWRDQYGETPWKVLDVHSTDVEQESGSPSGAAVFSVSGESSVQRDEDRTATEAVRWSCSAQTRVDDSTSVEASIQEVAFR